MAFHHLWLQLVQELKKASQVGSAASPVSEVKVLPPKSFSHHGSGKLPLNGRKQKYWRKLVFHWTMIVGGRVYTVYVFNVFIYTSTNWIKVTSAVAHFSMTATETSLILSGWSWLISGAPRYWGFASTYGSLWAVGRGLRCVCCFSLGFVFMSTSIEVWNDSPPLQRSWGC